MSDTQTPYTGSNYTAPVDAVYDPPGTLTSSATYCPECVRLRADLARMTSSAIEQQESRHELDKGLANLICALEADLARVTAERDALAKRWEALRQWLMDMFDADTGWDGEPRPNEYMRVEDKMRELEAGE